MRCADWPVEVNKVQQAAGASSALLSGQPRSSEPFLAHTGRSQGCLPACCARFLLFRAWFSADGSQSETLRRRLPLLQAPTAAGLMRPDATRLTGQQHSKAWMRSLRLLLMAGLALTVAERRVIGCPRGAKIHPSQSQSPGRPLAQETTTLIHSRT